MATDRRQRATDRQAAAIDAIDAGAAELEAAASRWDALAGFLQARRSLQQLTEQAARDDLVTELDDASDELATALDERDVAWRGDLELARIHAERTAVALAASATSTVRSDSYTRGDGPGSRTSAEP